MANGHGGRRPGAGRRQKTLRELAVTGDPGHRGRLRALPGGQLPEVLPQEAVPAPESMAISEREVWDELSVHAFNRRTLTPATMPAFRMLCRNIVLERTFWSDRIRDIGGANHRGLIKLIESALTAFDLRPMGKAVYDDEPSAAAPQSKLSRFLKHANA